MSRAVFRDGNQAFAVKDGKVTFGPVTPAQARRLAERVIEGQAHALTDPLALGTLAAAYLAFIADDETAPDAGAPEGPHPHLGAIPAESERQKVEA